MLTDIYKISRKGEFVGDTDGTESCVLAVAINGMTVEELNECQEKLERQGAFCLYFKGDRPAGVSIMNAVISVFFLTNYKYIDGRPVILVEGIAEKDCPPIVSTLKARMSAQGFEGLEIIGTSAMVRVSANEADFGEKYGRTLLNGPGFSKPILLEEESDWSGMHTVLKTREQAFEKENPVGFSQRVKLLELENEMVAKRKLVRAMEKEMLNLSTYVDFIRSGSQAAELQQFYNNEYEVLPRWYKRFGHLIKVITGKRNARSLYDNKVKKYKS